jgi:hypothetical protein
MHLTVDFWIDRTARVDELLADEKDVARIVSDAFSNDPNMVDLAGYPESLSGAEVAALIRAISKPYDQALFYRDGGTVAAADYDR